MSGVDVLAVMDRAKSVLLLCDPLVRSRMPPLMNSLEAQAFNARAEIDEARAAVAELIEADDEFDKCRAELRDLRIMLGHNNPLHQETPHLLRYEAAAKRRAAALSRVRGAE